MYNPLEYGKLTEGFPNQPRLQILQFASLADIRICRFRKEWISHIVSLYRSI